MNKTIPWILASDDQLPEDGQNVLVDTGSAIEPATFYAPYKQFQRYHNCMPGDRCITYYYSGVVAWWPFPEKYKGFRVTPEVPPPTPDISVPLDFTQYEFAREGRVIEGSDGCDNPAADVVRDQGCEPKTKGWTDKEP